jgi:hypothetical protein
MPFRLLKTVGTLRLSIGQAFVELRLFVHLASLATETRLDDPDYWIIGPFVGIT